MDLAHALSGRQLRIFGLLPRFRSASYNIEADFAIVSQSGKAFTFSHAGQVHGTFESGSRDFSFSDSGQNDDIKNSWADLCNAYTYRWTAYCNWDVQAAIDGLITVLKTAGTIITTVTAVVAAVS